MVDWNDIETVLLDMDGTLLDLHFDNFFWLEHLPRRYAEIFDRQQEEARLIRVARGVDLVEQALRDARFKPRL